MSFEFKSFNRKFLMEYIIAGVICLGFALWIDIRFGLVFFIIFALLPFVSGLMIKLALDKVSIGINTSHTVISKGDHAQLETQIQCDSFLVFAFLKINFVEDPHLDNQDASELLFSLGKNFSQTLIRTYQANIWGSIRLGIEKVEIVDFLGLWQYVFMVEDQSEEIKQKYEKRLEVLPNIPRIPENQLLREAVDASIADEDEQESHSNLSVGSVPGFEHREYIPGDSFKKINWKLSSKQDKYMVRLDEPIGKIKQNLVIDFRACYAGSTVGEEDFFHSGYKDIVREERLIEGVLAMAYLMAKQFLETSIYYYLAGKWHVFVITKTEDVTAFQFLLSKYYFISGASSLTRLPSDMGKTLGSIIFFTNSLDRELVAQLDSARRVGNQIRIVTSQEGQVAPTSNTWTVNTLFEFSPSRV